ncbi:MAG: AI-2E family transporter [Lachnospiraceae bacterium]|nr:AI-2E family transporter [Lachnospiraceae bacterium]
MEKNNVRAMNRTKRNMRTKRNLSRVKEYAPQGLVAFMVLAALMLMLFIFLKLPVIGAFIKKLFRTLAPAIAGFIFAFIMSPLVRFLETRFVKFFSGRRKGEPEQSEAMKKIRRRARAISILITMLFLLSIITVLLITIIPELVESLTALANNLVGYLNQLKDTIDSYLMKNPRVAEALEPITEKFSDTKKIAEAITKYLNVNMATDTAQFVWASAKTIVRVLYVWLVGMIVSVYLLASKEYYIGLCKKIFFAILPKRTSKNAIQTLHKANIIYSAAILGKLVDSLIIGILCFIGTTLLGIKFTAIGQYSVLVSVIVGVTNIIPFFGPFLGGIPCAILIFSIKPLHGLVFALFIVALQQFDGNFLDPHIVGKKVGLRPLYVLCACMLGGGLFGVPGLILATPTCALVYYLTKSYLEVRLESKNLPTETSEYVTHPSAVIAYRAMDVDMLTERLVAESDALDAQQEAALAAEESAAAVTGKKRRRRHRAGSLKTTGDSENMLDDESGELDLSAYDDLESGVEREKRLAREWLMSGGEEDLNDNGIADELEQAHVAESKPKRTTIRGLIRRMVDEAEEDWNELGNEPLPGSAKPRSDGEAEDTEPRESDEELEEDEEFSDDESDLIPDEDEEYDEADPDAEKESSDRTE